MQRVTSITLFCFVAISCIGITDQTSDTYKHGYYRRDGTGQALYARELTVAMMTDIAGSRDSPLPERCAAIDRLLFAYWLTSNPRPDTPVDPNFLIAAKSVQRFITDINTLDPVGLFKDEKLLFKTIPPLLNLDAKELSYDAYTNLVTHYRRSIKELSKKQ